MGDASIIYYVVSRTNGAVFYIRGCVRERDMERAGWDERDIMPNTGEKKRGGGGKNYDESKYHRFIYIIIVGFGEGYRVVVRRDDRSIAARGVGGWVGGWVGGRDGEKKLTAGSFCLDTASFLRKPARCFT